MKNENSVDHTTNEEEVTMNNEQLQNEILKEQLAQLKEMQEQASKPSLTVYILLALFLGGVGAHHFYNGKPIRGLFYLLFVWTMIPSVLAVIDIIVALVNKNKFK